MRRLLIILVVLYSYAGAAHSADTFEQSWTAADTMRQKAAALGYEWRDTGKLLKAAKKKAAAGNADKAAALVANALAQSEAAIAQAAREKVRWSSRVPKL